MDWPALGIGLGSALLVGGGIWAAKHGLPARYRAGRLRESARRAWARAAGVLSALGSVLLFFCVGIPSLTLALALVGLAVLALCWMAGEDVVRCSAAAYTVLRERRRHQRAGHRYLCAECLCFGEHPRWLSDDGEEAYCTACRCGSTREEHPDRRVRVLGTLTSGGLDAVAAHLRCEPGHSGTIGRLLHDDGRLLTCVVHLSGLPAAGRRVGRRHALCAVQAIWLDDAGLDALSLAQAADRFARLSGLRDEELRRIPLLVDGEALPPDVANALAGRFGALVSGVGLGRFLGGEAWATAAKQQAGAKHGGRRGEPPGMVEGEPVPPCEPASTVGARGGTQQRARAR